MKLNIACFIFLSFKNTQRNSDNDFACFVFLVLCLDYSNKAIDVVDLFDSLFKLDVQVCCNLLNDLVVSFGEEMLSTVEYEVGAV
jgi:hypothetical protein